MNKILKDPVAPKKKIGGDYPWDFKAPTYDNRSSCSISAGDDYGVGVRVPVGMDKPRSLESGPIVQKSHCFSPDEIFYGKHAEDKKG